MQEVGKQAYQSSYITSTVLTQRLLLEEVLSTAIAINNAFMLELSNLFHSNYSCTEHIHQAHETHLATCISNINTV